MAKYGLVGKTLGHSFSKAYFGKKFEKEKLAHTYVNFELETINEFTRLLEKTPEIAGLNVTIPYKEAIIPFLDQLDPEARAIGAVNTVKFNRDGRLTGYNTDHTGFLMALQECGQLPAKAALILGSGGASKAVKYALQKAGYKITTVSRNPKGPDSMSYDQVDGKTVQNCPLIVNCTPLGTWPNIEAYPPFPYMLLGPDHLLFDLVYNPEVTRFMELGKSRGARVCNGLKMLEYQAEKAWKIWNE
jgi:shikimate dehydrogenase